MRDTTTKRAHQVTKAAKDEAGNVGDGVNGSEPDEHDDGEFSEPFLILLASRIR